jgi:hypothetical protein
MRDAQFGQRCAHLAVAAVNEQGVVAVPQNADIAAAVVNE